MIKLLCAPLTLSAVLGFFFDVRGTKLTIVLVGCPVKLNLGDAAVPLFLDCEVAGV